MVLRLEVFETEETRTAPNMVVLDALSLEEAKLTAYDSGYAAGWEDAAAEPEEFCTRMAQAIRHELAGLAAQPAATRLQARHSRWRAL